MLCLSSFELYSRWVPLKTKRFKLKLEKFCQRTEKNLQELKRILTLRIVVTNIGHMMFIVLKKKCLTTHLLLTNPTAVFLIND